MIPLSRQSHSRFYRSFASVFHGLWLVCLLTTSALAQSGDDLFRGTWQIETPERGTLIVILKNQGRASYFWGDNADTTVYQGTWSSTPERATMKWPDGSQHRIERDQLGFDATYLTPNGTGRYTTPAQQVPGEILGQWAKPPTRDSELASDRDQAEGFFGIWSVGAEDSSDPHYVFVESDRSAASTWGDNAGLRGSWAKQGSELHIAWDSGHYSILRENRRGFAYKRIAPGEVIEDDTTEPQPAIRTNRDNVPATWLAGYEAERASYTGGIAFSSRKNARNFYRGDWVIQLGENQFERIEIKRFGGLATSLDRSLSGEWRMQGQDIFMRWDNGMRKILTPIGRGFVLYDYRPGRPLDGVPTRTRAAAPADTSKLADYAEEREDVAEQMRSLADAAGLDPSQQANSGWGRTFARWVWPFSDNTEPATSDAILEEEFEDARSSDPWWWPFWSENPDASAPSESAETKTGGESQSTPVDSRDSNGNKSGGPEDLREERSIEIEVSATDVEASPESAENDPETKTSPEAKPENSSKKRSSARDWVWPF
ncbi:MAG: hypothetical protein GVY36_07070 [Verrucomicrobia bacterium]|jgi:hypothetical protein|nr:hypothetical protein [Verrucomicrobiota bacterium]